MQNPAKPFADLVWESLPADTQMQKAREYMKAFRLMNDKLATSPDQGLLNMIKSEFEWNAISLVYFSNHIEHTGLSSEETYSVCIDHLKNSPPTSPNDDDIIDQAIPFPGVASKHTRNRVEIIQHMDAFLYLYDRIIVKKRPLDEQLIMNAHKIMMKGLVEDAGSYRNCPVYAGNHQFLPEYCVPSAMSSLVANYNAQLSQLQKEAEEIQQPFYLAAKLSYEFVTIHPFIDGNGRLCRLLLNIALLSMSVPFCSALGYSSGHKKARSHYFRCIKHARSNQGSTVQLASVVLYSYCAVSAAFFEKVRIAFPEYYFLSQDL
ncbi:hypothetical protein MP228_013048 [Amoeboaphelidium protococcarum]|nr:hypothetical protein MP228_013048 [Amoeboaphelidium protococcarum]